MDNSVVVTSTRPTLPKDTTGRLNATGNLHTAQPLIHLSRGAQIQREQLVDGVNIDWNRHELVLHPSFDLVLPRNPLRPLRVSYILPHVLQISVKEVSPILIHTDSSGVINVVIAVPADMGSSIHHQDFPAQKSGISLCKDSPTESRADDANVIILGWRDSGEEAAAREIPAINFGSLLRGMGHEQEGEK